MYIWIQERFCEAELVFASIKAAFTIWLMFKEYPKIFRDQGGGVRYLEIFQTDYDSLKTPVGGLVWALRIKYWRLMPAHYKALSSSVFSLFTTYTSLTVPPESEAEESQSTHIYDDSSTHNDIQ